MLEQKSSESSTLSVFEQGSLFDTAELERMAMQREQWEHTTVKKSLVRFPERDHLMTTSGVLIHRVYTPLDNARSELD